MNSDCFDYHYSSLNTKPSVNRFMITILESISSVDFLNSIKIAKGWKTLLQRTLEINDSLAIRSLQANSFKSNHSCLWSHAMRTLISYQKLLWCSADTTISRVKFISIFSLDGPVLERVRTILWQCGNEKCVCFFFLFKQTASFCNHRILILCSTRSRNLSHSAQS